MHTYLFANQSQYPVWNDDKNFWNLLNGQWHLSETSEYIIALKDHNKDMSTLLPKIFQDGCSYPSKITTGEKRTVPLLKQIQKNIPFQRTQSMKFPYQTNPKVSKLPHTFSASNVIFPPDMRMNTEQGG